MTILKAKYGLQKRTQEKNRMVTPALFIVANVTMLIKILIIGGHTPKRRPKKRDENLPTVASLNTDNFASHST